MRFLLLVGLLLAPTVVSASNSDDELNSVYRAFATAYQQLDIERIEQLYQPQALMMGVSDKKPFVEGRNDILAAYNKWFSKVAEREASIEIRFRASNRIHHDNFVIDAGYYQMRYQPSKESGESPSQFGGKFIFTLVKTPEGQWQIVADSATRVKQDLFVDSKPVSGLVYDDAFAIIPSKSSNKEQK